MLPQIHVSVDGRTKSYRSAKAIVASVQQGGAIPSGDVGAYLVGVFACQPLTADGKHYDLEVPGQWNHCMFKGEWAAALQGRDEFADEEKALILAGAALLRKHSHGWGNKAMAQAHVRKMVESWGSLGWVSSDVRSDPVTHSNVGQDAVPPRPLTRSNSRLRVSNNERTQSYTTGYFYAVIELINRKPTVSLYEVGRAWLIEWTAKELGYGRKQAEVMVDLHLDPRNFTIDCITDYEPINSAITRGESYDQVSELLQFEDVQTMLGVYRVHCRNLVNRQGVGDVNQGGPNETKAPKILAFLDSLDETNWHGFDHCEKLCDHYEDFAARDDERIFSENDKRSFIEARKLGSRLLFTKTKEAPGLGIMQGWLNVLKGMVGGVRYLKRFDLNIQRFRDHVTLACGTFEGIMSLLKEYKSPNVPEVGDALAPNFFADLGFKEFCKPDTHVCNVVNGIDGKSRKEQEVFEKLLRLAKESKVAPRQLDKVFFLAGSGNFYLANRSLSNGRSEERRSSLIHHLRRHRS